jgi:hypothetical protein
VDVDLWIQLGLHGPEQQENPIFLDPGAVGMTSRWSGSYHILAMGQHYDDYVITSRVLSLPAITGIPTAHPYQRLTGKIRAAGVTGNIGEAIAAILARRTLGAGIGDIAHIRPNRPFRRRKVPDYLMRIGHLMPSVFQPILPARGNPFNWPEWWPVEAKARSTIIGSNNSRNDALRQLGAYWSAIVGEQPLDVGYGLIVTFTYHPPREVRASLIVPRNQSALIAELQRDGDALNRSALRRYLYGIQYR